MPRAAPDETRRAQARALLGELAQRFPQSPLAARAQRLAWRLEAAFLAMGAAYMVLGLWGSVPLLLESYERDEFMGNVGVFTVRVWPIKTVIVLGLIVTFIEFTRQAIAAWRRAPAP